MVITMISGSRRNSPAKYSRPAMKAAKKLAADVRRFRELVESLRARAHASTK